MTVLIITIKVLKLSNIIESGRFFLIPLLLPVALLPLLLISAHTVSPAALLALGRDPLRLAERF